MSDFFYSVVIPVYNATESLDKIAIKIKRIFHNVVKAEYELILVNDSPEIKSTKNCLNKLAQNDENVVIVEFTKNYGQQAATLCGINLAKGNFIITMDDDLQHNPDDIPLLLDKKHHDIVIAKLMNKKHSFFKRFTSNIKGYFDYLFLGKPKHIKLSSFRLINAKIAKMMFARQTPYPFIPALLFSITHDVVNVAVRHNPRFNGKTNYTLKKLFKLFSNLLINNSSFLLRIIGYLGITSALLSFFLGASIIIKKLVFDYVVEGWTSIMVAILFLGGMILFALGIMGEYLLRILATTENRPVYFIRQVKIRETSNDQQNS